MNTKANLMRSIAVLFGLFLVTAASAGGKWVKLTKDFDRNIPFMKIKIGLPLNIHDNANVYFSQTPNDDSKENLYYYDTRNNYLYERGVKTDWTNLEIANLLGGKLHTFSKPMFFKGADDHASVGAIKIWYDDELVNDYKMQQEEAAAKARAEEEARAQAEEEARIQAMERRQQMLNAEKSALEWIKNTYDKVLNWYKEMSNELNEMSDESDSNNKFDESQYFTADFNRVLNVCKMAEKKTGELLGWDMSHWTFGQGGCDDVELSVQFPNVEASDPEHVKVKINILNGECSKKGGVLMVKENGEWKIDDFFIREDDGTIISEKKDDIDGIKYAGLLDYLLNDSE